MQPSSSRAVTGWCSAGSDELVGGGARGELMAARSRATGRGASSWRRDPLEAAGCFEAQWVSVLGFVVGERMEWVAEIFSVPIFK
jgi:hypothetical protein